MKPCIRRYTPAGWQTEFHADSKWLRKEGGLIWIKLALNAFPMIIFCMTNRRGLMVVCVQARRDAVLKRRGTKRNLLLDAGIVLRSPVFQHSLQVS